MERQEWVRVEVPASLLQVAVVAALAAAQVLERSLEQKFYDGDLYGFARVGVAGQDNRLLCLNIDHHICVEHLQSSADNTLGTQRSLSWQGELEVVAEVAV